MTNEKHTPGCEGGRYGCPRCKPDRWGILSDTDCGCIVETLSDGEVVVHHCHEHAAAPDLLAALEAASACLDALIEGRPILAAKVAGCTTAGNTAAEARAAIAKARGSA